MNFAVSVKQMTAAELSSEEMGISRPQLMENAAGAIYKRLREIYPRLEEKNILILCGSGNNGGDGAVLGCILRENGIKCRLILTGKMPDTPTAAKCLSSHVLPSEILTAAAGEEDDVKKAISESNVIIDCVFGTGFHGELPDNVKKLFSLTEQSGADKYSADIPSGVNGDTGVIAEGSFRPCRTFTLGAMKKGLLNLPCGDFCGETEILDIGIADSCYKEYEGIFTYDNIRRYFPPRPRSANKGTFGKLLNIAGCGSYIGAALLSSKAALKTGAGLVTLAAEENIIPIAAAYVPECVFLPLTVGETAEGDGATSGQHQNKTGMAQCNREQLEKLIIKENESTAVTIGCGMGCNDRTAEIAEYFIKNGTAPLVLDADGINSIVGNTSLLKSSPRPLILTPHPGEFARLTGLTVKQVQSDRLGLAKSFAAEHNVILLLKGSNTIIAAPDGRAYINTSGNTALAKAGCGDVLTGIIGGLLAMKVEPFTAAVLGAYLHGKAAEYLTRENHPASVLASEVAEALGKVI